MKATTDSPRSRTPRTKGRSAAACSKGSPPRSVTPSTRSRTSSSRASSTSGSIASPPAGSNMWGLQQPGQRIAQPWTQTAKRGPGPSASVTGTTAATRTGGIPHILAPRGRPPRPPLISPLRWAICGPAARPPSGGILVRHPEHRPRREGREHHPHARRRRRAEGEQRPPRHAHGRGRHGLRALDPPPPLRPLRAPLDRPGPVRPLGRPRLDARLLAAPPRRLRRHPRGPEELPAARLPHPRSSRVRPHRRRGGDLRPARPGLRERGGHGARPGHAVGAARPREPGRGPLRLRHRLRRRPHGGRGRRGGQHRRAPEARALRLPLRRQRDHHRRAHVARLLRRGRLGPLRLLRLARAERRRPRPRRHLEGHRRRQGRPAPQHHPGAHRHRLRRPEQAGEVLRARRPAGRGGTEGREGVPGLAAGAPLPRARRRAGLLGRGGRAPEGRARGVEASRRRLARRQPREGGAPRRPREPHRPGRPRGEAARGGRRLRRHPQALPGHDPEGRRAGAGARGRLRRPRRVEPHRHQGSRRRGRRRLRGAQRPLRHPRARHGLARERARLRRQPHPVRRDLLRLLRLHEAGGAHRRAGAPPGHLRLDPRLHLPRRGRPHPPAHRAPHRGPGHPQPPRGAPGRRTRDRARLGPCPHPA